MPGAIAAPIEIMPTIVLPEAGEAKEAYTFRNRPAVSFLERTSGCLTSRRDATDNYSCDFLWPVPDEAFCGHAAATGQAIENECATTDCEERQAAADEIQRRSARLALRAAACG